jgi:hypothetical protein
MRPPTADVIMFDQDFTHHNEGRMTVGKWWNDAYKGKTKET